MRFRCSQSPTVFGFVEMRLRVWHPLEFLLKSALIVLCVIPNSADGGKTLVEHGNERALDEFVHEFGRRVIRTSRLALPIDDRHTPSICNAKSTSPLAEPQTEASSSGTGTGSVLPCHSTGRK